MLAKFICVEQTASVRRVKPAGNIPINAFTLEGVVIDVWGAKREMRDGN